MPEIHNYKKLYQLQIDLVEKRYNKEIVDTLLLVEHTPVYTIGRGGSRSNLLVDNKTLKQKDIDFFEIDRGGDITYHGPGQIVGYPILDLRNHKRDLHWLLRSYEEVFLQMLKNEFKLEAKRINGYTGVWINKKKIVAIGAGVKKWITYHGFAFNYDNDLSYFDLIVPCGIKDDDKGVTSLKKQVPKFIITKNNIRKRIINYFSKVFNMELVE